jgi:phosphonate transport system substrate-binding protein
MNVKRRIWNPLTALALGAVVALAAACGDDSGDDGGDAAAGSDGWPDTIVYGLLPTEDVERVEASYAPLADYMEECLDHPFDVLTGTNYTAMIEAMRTGSIHVGKLGPFAYILGVERAGAEALVQPVENEEQKENPTYQSYIVTLESHGYESVEDLEGERFAFVDTASTSGFLFPRAMITEEVGVSNDDLDNWFGDVVFSGGHDSSVISVLNGDVDAAAISSNLWNNQIAEGGEGTFNDHENFDDLVILAETEDIPRTVEAIQGDLPEDLKEAVAACYTSEDAVLTGLPETAAAGYIPVTDDAYDVVRESAEALGMSPEELLEQE